MENQATITIVVIAYNRAKALERLLSSIEKANFSDFVKIPLLICIDKSENKDVIMTAESFEWKFGDKEIIAQEKRLGLREHIIRCGDLTDKHGSIIILEDDLYVSPNFYTYAQEALNFFKGDQKIAGIALYSYDFNELANRPFIPLDDGYDNYYMQVPCSWGQLWTRNQWCEFRNFYNSESSSLLPTDKISDSIINLWPDSSWKKYFYKYMVEKDKYFVYPKISYTTNYGDKGTHFAEKSGWFQVNLNFGKRKLNFSKFEISLSKYDAYFEILPEVIKKFNPYLSSFDFECDLYGTKEQNKIEKKYLLSIKTCSHILSSFSYEMIPVEMNIILGIKGNNIHFAESAHFLKLDTDITSKFYSKFDFATVKLAAFAEGAMSIKKSISYRLGNALLTPLKIIRNFLK